MSCAKKQAPSPISPSYEQRGPGFIERAFAYGCFGGAVQAGKRAIMSESFLNSAANAVAAGFFTEAGLRFLGVNKK